MDKDRKFMAPRNKDFLDIIDDDDMETGLPELAPIQPREDPESDTHRVMQRSAEDFRELDNMDDDEDFVDVSTDEEFDDEDVERRDLQQYRSLSTYTEQQEFDEEDYLNETIERQIFENRKRLRRKAPGDIVLVEDPAVVSSRQPSSDPGDNSTMKTFALLSAIFASVLICGFIWNLWYNPQPNIETLQTSGETTVGPGEVIPDNYTPTEIAGGDRDNGVKNRPEDVRVPEGGKLVTYEVIAEGDITSYSLAFMGGNGAQDSETGIDTVRWERSVGMRKNINPQLAVNTAGYGTITCTVTVDGGVVSTKTTSGDNPTVACTL